MKLHIDLYISRRRKQLYEDCLLYFGIREQKQILIIENCLLFFKIFPIKIYTLLHAFEPIVEALLPLYDWGISILFAWTASSGVEKRWPLILLFTYRNKKKSFGAKSELYGG